MSFEVFERPRPGKASDGTFVRVNKDRRILHLNAQAYRELGEPALVLLYRDGESIAISPAGPEDEAAFSSAHGNISCTRFIEAVGLMPGRRLPLRWEDGLLRTDGK